MNRNKLDVTLDLSSDRGRELLLRLVAISDAVGTVLDCVRPPSV